MTDKKHEEWPNLEANATQAKEAVGDKAEEATAGAKETKSAKEDDVTAQFQELGQRLVSTARTAWQSEQRQEFQQEVTDGLRSVRDQLTEAIDSVRSSSRTQEMKSTVKEKVYKVGETTRTNDLLDELRSGLASGLRELNQQLERLTERLEHRDEPKATGEAVMKGAEQKADEIVDSAKETTKATAEAVNDAAEQAMTMAHKGVDVPSAAHQATDEKPADQQTALPKKPEGPARGEIF